ncbi:AEC family transporter [Terasakiella sp. SH-1]|uniref:AEC family transporter n=1 Tax=Terasakiella sp. SH-1 TaxID=2560057 RepID=UPI0010734A64|nr:AEC family transporter [Terasakiella sp. SH-1]
MYQVLNVILPVFALIGLGYFMVKRGLFSQSGVDDLTRFIFYLAVPSLLFRTSASGVMTQRLELSILLSYYGMGVTILLGTYVLMRKIQLFSLNLTCFHVYLKQCG